MADHFFGITDTGKVRDNNEDAFIAQEIKDKKLILACVIDGVGGYSGGEIAAAIARDSIIDHLKDSSNGVIRRMKEAFILASEKIDAQKDQQPQYANMACVLTLAVVDNEANKFYYAHLGDTRLYLFRDNTLVKVSKDHSFVGFLEESGRLTEEAAMQHPKRNEINKALGLGVKFSASDDYIETGESPFLPGDLLLLCSDGLTDMVNRDQITSILNSDASLKEKGAQLIAIANENGGKDNITVVLVQNNKARQTQEVIRPAAAAEPQMAIASNERRHTTDISTNTEKNTPEPVIREPLQKQNNNMRLVGFLSLASVVLLITSLALLWLHLQPDPVKAETSSDKSENPAIETRNEQELKLQEVINTATGDTVVLSAADFPLPVIISDTILIQKDTLYIETEGSIIFTADPRYEGPALLLASTSKYISIDSLVFQNFATGISVYNNALHLKDVKFNNCRIPIQNLFTFEDNKYVNGRIMKGSFKKDSLPRSSAN